MKAEDLVEVLLNAMQEVLSAHANDDHRPRAFYIASEALQKFHSAKLEAALPLQPVAEPPCAQVSQISDGRWVMQRPVHDGVRFTYCATGDEGQAEAQELADFWNEGAWYVAAMKEKGTPHA